MYFFLSTSQLFPSQSLHNHLMSILMSVNLETNSHVLPHNLM